MPAISERAADVAEAETQPTTVEAATIAQTTYVDTHAHQWHRWNSSFINARHTKQPHQLCPMRLKLVGLDGKPWAATHCDFVASRGGAFKRAPALERRSYLQQ